MQYIPSADKSFEMCDSHCFDCPQVNFSGPLVTETQALLLALVDEQKANANMLAAVAAKRAKEEVSIMDGRKNI